VAVRAPKVSTGLKFDPNIIGTTGLKQSGGTVTEEFLRELQGAKGAAVFREMALNDAIVGAMVFSVSMLLRHANWTVQAADDSVPAEDAKIFVESVLDEMTTPMEDVMDEVCSMFTYGFAPLEIVWVRRDDGSIGVKKMQLRAQTSIDSWEIDDATGRIYGLWQQPTSGPQVFIPIEKMLLFRTTVERNNPEGRSLLRTAYRAWRNKKRIEEIEGVGLERDLAGLPLARIPGRFFSADASPDEQAVFAGWTKMVTNVRLDKQQGIVIPSDRDASGNLLYEFALLSGGGSRQIDTTKIIERYDRAMATSILADFIFLGQSSVGSFALSSDKTALFATAIGGFMKAIASVFNRHLMTRLWDLNAFDPALRPVLKPGDIETQNLGELSQYLSALAGSGMMLFPDRELENHLRSAAGLPEAAEDGVDMETPEGPGTGDEAEEEPEA
jgi:hypothetical protein